MRSRLSQFDFKYTPAPGFDTRKVKGLAAPLLVLRPKDHGESTTGSKLYNVAVEDERVSKDLLERVGLRNMWRSSRSIRSVRFKISAKVRPVVHSLQVTDDYVRNPTCLQKLKNAKHLALGKVRPALSLVGYPDEVAEPIAFVFNDTLTCDDAATARAVTFARNVGVRSVTLDGDVYEPSGAMSGGAAPSESGMLVRAQELRAAEGRIEDARRTLEALERDEVKERAARVAWRARHART